MKQALKLALEALEDRVSLMKWQIARDAVKEALAQPEQEPVTHLWECLGTWSAYLVTNGEQANCAPPSWLVEAVRNATTPPQPKYQSTAEKSKLEKVPAKGTLLAQPEHEWLRGECVKCGQSIERQEPVAWAEFDGEGGYHFRAYEDNEDYAEQWDKRNPNHVGWVKPLYEAPPKPEQEPVAYLCENAVGHKYFRWKKPSSTYKPIALYTAPPQRTWVGLTHQERNAIRGKYWIGMSDAVFDDIEDILKDKNT